VDTIIANKGLNFTLTDASLSSTDGMALNLKRITDANLTGIGTSRVFTVTGWTGTGSLTAASGIVTATESINTTLTNTALTAGTMTLSLNGITKANLTAMTLSGQPSVILDASGFTGTTNLTASGSGPAILFGGSGNGGKLKALGTGNTILIGGPGTDTLTAFGAGQDLLIGGGGADTIKGNGQDILISGTTSYGSNTSANLAALEAILAEWASSDLYATKISKLSSGITVGSKTYILNATTVRSDGVANTLSDGTAATQNNWFIVNSKDNDSNRKANETVTTIN
jgi:hypothetical protein